MQSLATLFSQRGAVLVPAHSDTYYAFLPREQMRPCSRAYQLDC